MSFYIDISKASERGLVGRLSFSVNGIKVDRVIAAKHGKNGFVEYYPYPYVIKDDYVVSRKIRGNVKISIKPHSAGFLLSKESSIIGVSNKQ